MSFIGELKRRNVLRAATAYVAVSWLIIEVVDTLFPVFGLGETAIRIVVTLLACGFIPAVIVAWAFEWTPEGFKREADVDHATAASRRMTRRIDRLLVAALTLALGLFILDKLVLDPRRDAAELETATEQAREEGRVEARQLERDNSIAVLAFQDLSPSGDQAFFSEGLAEDILNNLARIASLRVTGKTSAFSFKGSDATVAEIGEALNVAHVLEGSVARAGDRIRLSVQLIDTRSDTLLWSETYDETIDDIFAIRDDISNQVAKNMPIRIVGMIPKSERTDPRVYSLTLRARAINEMGAERPQDAQALLDEALAIDPDYVPALLESIYPNYWLMQNGAISDDAQNRFANDIITRVLTLDPDNGHALATMAFGKWDTENDWEGAATDYMRTLKVAPGDIEALRYSGIFAYRLGRPEEAIKILERCRALDPFFGRCGWHLALAYLWAGQYEKAEAIIREDDDTIIRGNYYLVLAMLLQGKPQQALADWKLSDENLHPQRLSARAMILHDLGRTDELKATLESLHIAAETDRPWSAYYTAEAYAWMGDIDAAFEWLDRAAAADEKFGHQGWQYRRRALIPVLQKLHDDPRWDALRERMGMPEERLAEVEFAATIPQ